jgi:hypothetical protein
VALTVLGVPAGPVFSADSVVPSQAVVASTVWTVAGQDSRGSYAGKAELIPDAGAYRFIRVIDYSDAVKVENGRSLSWVWQGRAKPAPNGGITVSVVLNKADFIRSRGSLVRSDKADVLPVLVTGQFSLNQGEMKGLFKGPDGETTETWALPVQGGAQPIFVEHVTETPTHSVIPKNTRIMLFNQFSGYHALPEVQPYVNRPEFRNPLHTVISDKTDFDFYQQNPGRLRVVNKPIDAISLQETLARADAYKWSLAGKADFYERLTSEKMVDPATGMLFEFVDNFGKGYPSHDAALWTGAYVAGQYLRYWTTGHADALTHIAKSTDGLLTLLEITPDPRIFARTLRKAEGNPIAPWYPGNGPFSGLEWKQGGNNDMFKGVMFGLTAAQAALCDQPKGNDGLCARLKADVVRVVFNLNEAQGSGYNRLAALWLAAYATHEPVAIAAASKEWNRQASALANGSNTLYWNGITDWSGTHLAAVQYLMFNVLSIRYPLPGIDTKAVLKSGVENIYRQFAKVPMGLWSVAFAKLGTIPHADAASSALWRLREFPAPKRQLDIDHRIRPDFVMSPFPSASWKNDWAVNDRTQSLRMYPLFEASAYTVYDWKQSPLEYKANNVGGNFPGADYLLAYWLGRLTGVFSSTD